MAWDFSSGKAIYIQIAEYIKADILSGKYKSGEKIPSVRDLALDAGVNPNTMQRALTELDQWGMVSAQKNSGHYVSATEETVSEAKKVMAENYANTYITNMRWLGYSDKDLKANINEMLKGDNDNGNNA